MQSYYKKLLAPREDYLQLTRNRLESLKALADARNKILTLNDTVCDSENTLTSALHACHAEGLPISAVKFKKKTLRTGQHCYYHCYILQEDLTIPFVPF